MKVNWNQMFEEQGLEQIRQKRIVLEQEVGDSIETRPWWAGRNGRETVLRREAGKETTDCLLRAHHLQRRLPFLKALFSIVVTLCHQESLLPPYLVRHESVIPVLKILG